MVIGITVCSPVEPFEDFCSLFLHQVMQSLRFALQPTASDISVKWDLPKTVTATPLSPPITVIFQGQRLLTYYQLSGKVESLLLRAAVNLRPPLTVTAVFPQTSPDASGCVTVEYKLKGQVCSDRLQFSLKTAEDSG